MDVKYALVRPGQLCPFCTTVLERHTVVKGLPVRLCPLDTVQVGGYPIVTDAGTARRLREFLARKGRTGDGPGDPQPGGGIP